MNTRTIMRAICLLAAVSVIGTLFASRINPPPAAETAALYRVDAGGTGVVGAQLWEGDTETTPSPFVTSESKVTSTPTTVDITDPSVPAGTPESVFKSGRKGLAATARTDLSWTFPVPAGNYQVRLYFAETSANAQAVGARVFDIVVENRLVTDNFDVFKAVGGYKAMVQKYPVSSDSALNVDLKLVAGAPQIQGIDVSPAAAGSTPPAPAPDPDAATAPETSVTPSPSSVSGSEPSAMASTGTASFTPFAETPPARGSGDVADDPAIWVHPSDKSQSLVIGSNKSPDGGLSVYDMQGRELQFLQVGKTNNVDIRGNVVASSNVGTNSVDLFRIDPATRRLTKTGSFQVRTPAIYGICLYQSSVSGEIYAFPTFDSGVVEQYKLNGTLVRSFDAGTKTEGCVADDQGGQLYVGVQDEGVFRYSAEPAAGSIRTTVDRVATHLRADIEGMSIHQDGYLVVSSQGSSTFAVYTRQAPNAFVGSFSIEGAGSIDAVTRTDGVDVNKALDLLVVHDNSNTDGAASNFKYLRWSGVASGLGLSGPTEPPSPTPSPSPSPTPTPSPSPTPTPAPSPTPTPSPTPPPPPSTNWQGRYWIGQGTMPSSLTQYDYVVDKGASDVARIHASGARAVNHEPGFALNSDEAAYARSRGWLAKTCSGAEIHPVNISQVVLMDASIPAAVNWRTDIFAKQTNEGKFDASLIDTLRAAFPTDHYDGVPCNLNTQAWVDASVATVDQLQAKTNKPVFANGRGLGNAKWYNSVKANADRIINAADGIQIEQFARNDPVADTKYLEMLGDLGKYAFAKCHSTASVCQQAFDAGKTPGLSFLHLP